MSPIGISTLLSPLIQKVSLHRVQRMKIAVDMNALMFVMFRCSIRHRIKEKFSVREASGVLNHEAFERAECEEYCIDTIKTAITILREEFDCVFVFDGKAFSEKQAVIKRRAKRHAEVKEALTRARRIFKQDLSDEENAKHYYNALFESIELNIAESPASLDVCAIGEYEADVTCAHMCQSREVDAVLSSDYDSLLFGCPYLIKDIDLSEGYADIVMLQDIYDYFSINHAQVIDICILMGTDYNEKISGVGPKTALSEIQSHGRLEDTKYHNKEQLNINRLREIYNCTYSKQGVRWFSLESCESLDMLGSPIKIS